MGLYEYCHGQPSKFIDPEGKQIMPPMTGSGYPFPQHNSPIGGMPRHPRDTKRCTFRLPGMPHPSHVGPMGSVPGIDPIPINSASEIPGHVEKNGCCEILFLSHQGEGENPGGISSKDPVNGYTPYLPSPDGNLEKEIRTALDKNGCKKNCEIFLYACGQSPGSKYYDTQKNARKKLAKDLGCTVWGTKALCNFGAPGPEMPRACTLDESHWEDKPTCYCKTELYPYAP